MERLDADIGFLQPAFNKTPEILKPVGVNLPITIVLSMVYNCVLESKSLESVVRCEVIGVDRAPRLDVGANLGFEQMFFAIADNLRADQNPRHRPARPCLA